MLCSLNGSPHWKDRKSIIPVCSVVIPAKAVALMTAKTAAEEAVGEVARAVAPVLAKDTADNVIYQKEAPRQGASFAHVGGAKRWMKETYERLH
jgi:hypothetical protein